MQQAVQNRVISSCIVVPILLTFPIHASLAADGWKGFRNEAQAYFKCNAEAATRLAFEQASPTEIATAARARCTKFEEALAVALRRAKGASFALKLWSDFRKKVLEANMGHVLETRNRFRQRSLDCEKSKSVEERIDECSKLLSKFPGTIEALLARGVAYAEAKEGEKAITDFTAVIDLGGRSKLAYKMRGIIRLQARDAGSAKRDFEAAIELDPLDAGLHEWKGFSQQDLGDREGAVATFKSILALPSSYGENAKARENAKFKLYLFCLDRLNEAHSTPPIPAIERLKICERKWLEPKDR